MEIIISRPTQYMDRIRSYQLLIDGIEVGKIEAGEEIRLTLPENAKILLAKIDWCSSNEFNLQNIHQKLEVKNSFSTNPMIPFYFLYALIIKRKSYLNISPVV